MMFCPKCGNQTEENAKFCNSCGAALAPARASQISPGGGDERIGIPAPGYSDRINHSDVIAALKKNRKASGVFGLILIPLPLIGFVIYAAVSGEMELGQAALYGGIVSAVFLIFALISRFRQRESAGYEGVVTDKKSRLRSHSRSDSSVQETYTEYITYVRTSDGKSKKIVENSHSMVIAYNYLEIGDRFRYLPQFNFPYEKYDKSKAPYLGCVACGTHNPVESDRCSRCHTPLLK